MTDPEDNLENDLPRECFSREIIGKIAWPWQNSTLAPRFRTVLTLEIDEKLIRKTHFIAK